MNINGLFNIRPCRVVLWLLLLIATISGGINSVAAEDVVPKDSISTEPAVFVTWRRNEPIEKSLIAKRLHGEFGFEVAGGDYKSLKNWDFIRQFNVLMLTEIGILDRTLDKSNLHYITPEDLDAIVANVQRFLEAGGGVYLYGYSFSHMGNRKATATINYFLKPFGAEVLFADFHDPSRETRQKAGKGGLYAQADTITTHPATAGVKNWWYAIGTASGYGVWTRPLVLDKDWTPLVQSSTEYTTGQWLHDSPTEELQTEYKDYLRERAVIYAAREYKSGRMIINGSEPTISVYGYGFSPYADEQYGRITMEAGLEGIPSDGMQLMVSSLKWLAAPSIKAASLGGYTMPPPEINNTGKKTVMPMTWNAPAPLNGERKYMTGVFGVRTEVVGGTGTVADYAAKAKALDIDFIVCTADFEKIEKVQWDKLVAECKAVSNDKFLAEPAMITRDIFGNAFLQVGDKCWPEKRWLYPENPKRVRNHLGYWMNQAGFSLRAPILQTQGTYPAWLHSGCNAFAVRTFEKGELVEDLSEGLRISDAHGDRNLIFSLTFVDKPSELEHLPEKTHFMANDLGRVGELLTGTQYSGGMISYVSSGPRVINSNGLNIWRGSPASPDFVPGTSRWRIRLKLASENGLQNVIIYDGTEEIEQRYFNGETEAELSVDGLHDNRHTISFLVRDCKGKELTTGSMITGDPRMRQNFCSDRCNIMLGSSDIRKPDGSVVRAPATPMLYKAGRLYSGPVAPGGSLPGVDGSGSATDFSLDVNLFLYAEDEKQTEDRAPVHKILRTIENADLITYHTPILKRSTERHHLVFAHNPYVPLVEPRIEAGMVQRNFRREWSHVWPTWTKLYMKIPDNSVPVTLKPGWKGMSLRWGTVWNNRKNDYAIIRTNNEMVSGPNANEPKTKRWVGDLHRGDSLIMTELGEGFVVLGDEPVYVIIESDPETHWFRIYVGSASDRTLAVGETVSVEILLVKVQATQDELIDKWIEMRNAFGIGDGAPQYAYTLRQGQVISTDYILEAQAEDFGFSIDIPKTTLPQRLPFSVAGVNPLWTAGRVDLRNNIWQPLKVEEGLLWGSLDTTQGAQELYIGNLVILDIPRLKATLLPSGTDKPAQVEIYNPTQNELTTMVKIPVDSFLAPAQEMKVTVPAHSLKRVTLTTKEHTP